MGVYINIIAGANIKATNHKGEKIQINHAPYFGKCWYDSWAAAGEPTCLEETKSFKKKYAAANRRKRTELVCFEIPAFDGRWETHQVHRNIDGAYYDTPDYTREGAVAIMKAFPEGNLIVPRYAEGYDRLEERWVPIRINEVFPWGINNEKRNPLDIWSVHAEQWDEEIGEYWHRTSYGFEDLRFPAEGASDYPKVQKKSGEAFTRK